MGAPNTELRMLGLKKGGDRKQNQKVTSKAVTPLLSFFLKARLSFIFFNMVSYNINCIEGLLTCGQ